jgi:SpoVK/Ycf46/Vps4 family AAA+-type ATPase
MGAFKAKTFNGESLWASTLLSLLEITPTGIVVQCNHRISSLAAARESGRVCRDWPGGYDLATNKVNTLDRVFTLPQLSHRIVVEVDPQSFSFQLLVSLDGFSGTGQVVTICATNQIHMLDRVLFSPMLTS